MVSSRKAPQQPSYVYRALVVRVIDGDTIVLQVDVGFRFSAELPIRLLGINAPEKNTPQGQDSLVWVTDWAARHPTVTVTTLRNPEKYGRWLGTVVGDDGSVLNTEVVAAGHALGWDGKGKPPV